MRIFLFFILVSFNSCFLFSDFTKRTISYHDTGSMQVVVPKRFHRAEMKTDSAGNQVQYYYYGSGTVLYFAKMKDTSTALQYINYDMNLPKDLLDTKFYKGVNEDNRYWRESRNGDFKAGYYKVHSENDGIYDSSLNYFTQRSLRVAGF